MSILSKITKGKIQLPHLVLVHASDGLGKSTFGSEAPNPIFLGPEKGTFNLDVSRLPAPESWNEILEQIDVLINESHQYKTLVVDSLDWIEPFVHKEVQGDSVSLNASNGGYGACDEVIKNYWRKLCDKLSQLRSKGIHIILIAHSTICEFNDPATEKAYSRYELKLRETKNCQVRSIFREFVDSVLFINYIVATTGEGKNVRGISDQVRKIYTERTPAYDAKNRFGLPMELPCVLGSMWSTYCNAIKKAGPRSIDLITKEINELMNKIKDDAILKKVQGKINEADSSDKLETILKRLKRTVK